MHGVFALQRSNIGDEGSKRLADLLADNAMRGLKHFNPTAADPAQAQAE
jgi:hypothetical protein